MKKYLSIILLSCFIKADIIIAPNDLPARIQDFIKTNFKANIGLALQDDNTYEVYLSDGTELEFFLDGDYKEIETKNKPINWNILPTNISLIIQNKYPQAFLIEIEKKINHYEIKLSNNMKIYIDSNGTILREKFDD